MPRGQDTLFIVNADGTVSYKFVGSIDLYPSNDPVNPPSAIRWVKSAGGFFAVMSGTEAAANDGGWVQETVYAANGKVAQLEVHATNTSQYIRAATTFADLEVVNNDAPYSRFLFNGGRVRLGGGTATAGGTINNFVAPGAFPNAFPGTNYRVIVTSTVSSGKIYTDTKTTTGFTAYSDGAVLTFDYLAVYAP